MLCLNRTITSFFSRVFYDLYILLIYLYCCNYDSYLMMYSVEDRIEMNSATRDKVSIDLIPSTSVASVTCSAIF